MTGNQLKLNDMKKEKLHLGINTTDTFTAANGTTSDYQSIFEGILQNITRFAERGGRKLRREDIEDMAQDAFTRAVMYHGSFDPDRCTKPQGFGYRIAENSKADLMNRLKKQAATFTDLEYCDKDGDEYVPYHIAGYRVDEFEADRAVEQAEMEDLINETIGRLNEGYQELMKLYFQGYKTGEIAEELGLDPDVAYIRLCRAKKAFRNAAGVELEDYLDFDD